MITVARLESELDYWFSADPPVCSVLWLLGSSSELVPALASLAEQVNRFECRAAACVPATRPPLLSAVEGCDQLLRAELKFTGSAIDGARSPLPRHPSSSGSVCEVVSAIPGQGDGIWRTLAHANMLSVCAGLFPSGSAVPAEWPFSATRLVMIAGTAALRRGAADGRDALLHAFLADTLQGGGIAAIKVSTEECGTGVALTGSSAAIDEAEQVFATAARAGDVQVRHSLAIGGPCQRPAAVSTNSRQTVADGSPANTESIPGQPGHDLR